MYSSCVRSEMPATDLPFTILCSRMMKETMCERSPRNLKMFIAAAEAAGERSTAVSRGIHSSENTQPPVARQLRSFGSARAEGAGAAISRIGEAGGGVQLLRRGPIHALLAAGDSNSWRVSRAKHGGAARAYGRPRRNPRTWNEQFSRENRTLPISNVQAHGRNRGDGHLRKHSLKENVFNGATSPTSRPGAQRTFNVERRRSPRCACTAPALNLRKSEHSNPATCQSTRWAAPPSPVWQAARARRRTRSGRFAARRRKVWHTSAKPGTRCSRR